MKIFDMDVFLSDAVKVTATLFSKRADEIILSSLIGSKITGFELKKDKTTKNMYNLIITTDAKEVEIPQRIMMGEEALMFVPNKIRYDPSVIKLRVRR